MPYQLCYVSSSRQPQNAETLEHILATSRRNNAQDEITGLLVYHDQVFFQVLEGDRARVAECFRRIEQDPRHSRMSLLYEEDAGHRAFPDWQMAFAQPDDLQGRARADALSLVELQNGGVERIASDPTIAMLARGVLDGFRS